MLVTINPKFKKFQNLYEKIFKVKIKNSELFYFALKKFRKSVKVAIEDN